MGELLTFILSVAGFGILYAVSPTTPIAMLGVFIGGMLIAVSQHVTKYIND